MSTEQSRFSPTRRRLMIFASLATLASRLGISPSYADNSPLDGGNITFLIDSLGDTWIPNNSAISSFQGNVWGHVTDKLVYVDSKGKVSPWIAEDWQQNEDATRFTLHLKKGVTFSDGSPLDAAAVVDNLNIWARGRIKDGINPIGLFPKTYQQARVIDPATVEVLFTAPTLGFIATLGYHGSILVSPRTLKQPAEIQANLSQTSGSGPFIVEDWQEANFVRLRKRKDYHWGPPAVGHTGPAFLDSITYKLVAERSLRVASVTAGQAEVAFNALPQELQSLQKSGFGVAAPRYLGFVNGWAINTKEAPYDDVRVRQALQAAINRPQIIETIYTPQWLLATSFIQSNVPGVTNESPLLKHDPDRAAQLLDEAGWKKGSNGIRVKDGKPLTLDIFSNPYLATSSAVDELIAQQLTALGWKVNIQAYDVVTYGQRVKVGKQGIPAYEITRSFIDAGTVASILTNANNGEDWFALEERDKTLNQLRDGIAGAVSLEARQPLLDQLQHYVLEQGYFIPRTQIVQRIYLQSPRLKGEVYNGLAYASYYTARLTG